MVKVETPQRTRPRGLGATLVAMIAALAFGTVFAQSYNEAPMLAELVEAGELPPVEERLPDDPLVIEPVDRVGEYGGVMRRAFLGPADANNYVRVVYDALVRFDSEGAEIVPHIVRDWEANDDFTTWTLHLRPGAKWSDGEPFTADAIMFWYDSVVGNEDLTASVPTWIQNEDGSAAVFSAVDDYTVQVEFDEPNTLFLTELTFRDGADRTLAMFLPGHYLSQFHPDHAGQDAVDALVDEAELSDWTQLFRARAAPPENPDRPTMAAWVPHESTVSDSVFTIRRNPYYIGVDTEGNQLPYIDEVEFRFFADAEALNFAAVAGEFDFQARHIQMTNYPVLIDNAERSGYEIITWPTFGGNDAAVWINQNYTINEELGELLQERDFRTALSVGIDREEIKQSAFLGLGEARQPVAAPWHPYYPGDEYAFMDVELDVERANALLDELGLERGGDDMRTLPSGEPLRLEISVVPAFGEWPDVAQLVAADWERLGVATDVQVRERNAHFTMRDSNELMLEIWNEDTTAFPFTGNPKIDPRSQPATIFAVDNRTWYRTDGEEGTEPSATIARIVEIIDTAKTVGTEQQIELAQELGEIIATEHFSIGTVGLTPMIQGVVVKNQDLMNVPDLVANDWPLRTPGDARPEQFFFDR